MLSAAVIIPIGRSGMSCVMNTDFIWLMRPILNRTEWNIMKMEL